MKKQIWIPILIIAVIIVGLIIFLPKTEISKEKQTIKIGVLAPLTGNSASMGEGVKNGVLLAKEQMDIADKKYNYEIILEDDKAEPQTVAIALQKLINIDKVDALISMGGVSGNVVAPITQENKIVHVGNTNSIGVAKGEFNFIHWTQPKEYSEAWIKKAKKEELTRVAVLAYNNPAALDIINALKEDIKNQGIEIVSENIFNVDEKDFRTMIMKAKKASPDVYIIGAFSPTLELLAKQLKELGVDKPLTGFQAFEFTKQVDLFEGQWYSATPNPSEEFTMAYNEKYKKTPIFTAPPAYDAFNLIVTAFEKSGKNSKTKPISKEVVNAFLGIKNFPGMLGTLNVDEQGIIHSPAIIKKVENGKFLQIND